MFCEVRRLQLSQGSGQCFDLATSNSCSLFGMMSADFVMSCDVENHKLLVKKNTFLITTLKISATFLLFSFIICSIPEHNNSNFVSMFLAICVHCLFICFHSLFYLIKLRLYFLVCLLSYKTFPQPL